MKPNSFTLIELVIVIAVLSILSAVVVITINPAEQMKSARDSRRAEELTTINKAISLYVADGGSSLGSTNTVYVSIPDSSATCANLGLPTLPTGWSYHCSTSVNLQKTDSTGWIPVNFSSISFTTPLSSLPVDPVNTTSTGNYYTYITGGSWELTSSMESAKYKLGGANDKTSKDGGSYTGLYELGTNLTLLPLDYGDTSLVGYWKFDEGSGTTAYDASGHNNNGTLTNGPTYTTGKVGSYALSFDGTDDWVNIGNGSIINFGTGNFSIVFYFKTANLGGSNNNAFIGNKSTAGGANPGYHINTNNGKIRVQLADGVDAPSFDGLLTINDNNYHLCAIVINKSSLAKIYIDNVLDNSLNDTMLGNTNGEYLTSIGAGAGGGWHRFSGVIDDIRIYNRALSAAEISALYNATNK